MLLLLVLGVCLWQSNGQIQEKPITAQSIIERYNKLKGGRDKLTKIKNYRFSSTISVGKTEICKVKSNHAKGKFHREETFPDGAVKVTGCNLENAWLFDVNQNARLLSPEESKPFIRENTYLHPSLHWTKLFSSITLLEEETYKNQKVFHLLFKGKKGNIVHRYFNKETGLLVREKQTINSPKITSIDTQILDYRKNKFGTLSPRKLLSRMTTVDGKVFEYSETITTIEINQLNEKKDFPVPEAVKKLLNERND